MALILHEKQSEVNGGKLDKDKSHGLKSEANTKQCRGDTKKSATVLCSCVASTLFSQPRISIRGSYTISPYPRRNRQFLVFSHLLFRDGFPNGFVLFPLVYEHGH